jgi:hypothetical protein
VEWYVKGFKLSFVLGLLALSMLVTTNAAGDGLPKLIKAGDYKCKVSDEYKLRGCKVVDEGDQQFLVVDTGKHLLLLKGPIYPADHIGKVKRVHIEASLLEDKPYICTTRSAAANEECKSQKVMITLDKKGSSWVGGFVIKHYWDKYEGKGDERKVVGHEITAEKISFTLKL